MNKDLQNKLRREELAFKTYATEKLAEAYPNSVRVIQLAAICPANGRRRISAWIDSELAFGAGGSNAKAVERLIGSFKPKTAERKADYERAHTSNLLPVFSDHE